MLKHISKIVCLTLLGLICIILPSCNGNDNTVQSVLQSVVDDQPDEKKSFQYLIDKDSAICLSFPNDIATLSKHFFQTGETIKIGTIPNYYLATDTTCRIDDTLYFYVGVNTAGIAKNMLYCINLKTNELVICNKQQDNSVPGLLTYQMKRNVVTMKNVVNEDDSISTFFDLYDTDSGNSITFHQQHWKSYDSDGTAIFAFYADDEYLYSFQDEYTENGSDVKTKLLCFDSSLNEIKNIEMKGDALEFIKRGRIKEAYVRDDILFLQNVSSHAFLGKLDGNTITTIFKDENMLQMAANDSKSDSIEELFYFRRSNKLGWFDKKTSTFLQAELPLDQTESIRSILVSGNVVLLQCYVNDDEDTISYKTYTMDFEHFLDKQHSTPLSSTGS